jgi:hypothetical protein
VLSGGRVAAQQFFVAAVVGAPVLWTEARELIREGDIVDAIEGGVSLTGTCATKVQYLISGELKGEAEALGLICPSFRNKCPIRSTRLKPLSLM